MSSSFWTWIAVAGALAVGLLLLLGSPGMMSGDESASVENTAVSETATAQYWEPVAQQAAAPVTVVTTPTYGYGTTTSVGCSSCGIQTTAGGRTPTVAGGVPLTTRIRSVTSSYAEPVRSACATCGAAIPTGVYAGGCGLPDQACSGVPCTELTRPCSSPATYACSRCGTPYAAIGCGTCASTCAAECVEKPRINRNEVLCVNECSFIQLHSTVPHPICDAVSFEWSATRGSFLNPHDPDPVFYAPGTRSAYGEDVWVILTVVDQYGIRYTDQVEVHVNNAF